MMRVLSSVWRSTEKNFGLISRRSYRMLTLSDGHLHGGLGE
jgi:hypothetical protein